MAGVHVVTDSACDLTPELAASADISIVPLTIRFGDEELLDRRDLTPEEFWRRCAATTALPETSAPSPGAFHQVFADAAGRGFDAVVCLTISSLLSATFQSAQTAAASTESLAVHVVDTRSVTMGQGIIALAAAEAAAQGMGAEQVVAEARDRAGRMRVYGAFASLDHLQRGGRIGSAAALVGSLLSIKPVIQVRDGIVAEESKQRTRARSLDYLAAKVRAAPSIERLAVCNGAAPDIDSFLARLDGIPSARPRMVVDLGPVVGTHAGPGTIGVCFEVSGATGEGG